MIIRAPTRTKTNSFHGQQMSFKFPSTESLRDTTLDEYHLNNHHLLNDNMGKNFDEVASQILSDYTSASNTNTNSGHSSNGYYSFANISDNTTSSPKAGVTNNIGTGISSDYNSASDQRCIKTPVLGPLIDHEVDGKISCRSSPCAPMEMIPEGNGFTSFSTAFQSIPTAANISYNIASTASSSNSMETGETTIRKSPQAKLHRTPTITRVESTASTRSSWESSRRSTKLKRSKAVRCKGGLLQYFILLGIRLKRQLRNVICSIRNKLSRRKKGKAQDSRLSSFQADGPYRVGAQQQRLRQREPKTSHLKRTQRYVSNLQRSMSCKSLQPVLMSRVNSSKAVSNNLQESTELAKSDVTRNPTTSLRRTNSSIKRAASVITTPRKVSEVAKGSSGESFSSATVGDDNEEEKKMTHKAGLVRSTGSRSLSSIARQPSIVVKNKVIPLSMHHYSIEEEEEDDEYVISTNSMRPLSPMDSENSDDAYEDAQGHLGPSPGGDQKHLSESLNHYFRAIISQRITMRLQMARYQDTGLPASDFIGSLIKEYESDSSMSDLFEELKSRISTTDATSEETEEGEEDQASSHYSSNNSLAITFNSPFGNMNRLSHANSLLSLPTATVKRSLTLPIGIKV